MAQIGISYTPSGGSPVYNFVLDNFGGNEMPRSYLSSADFSQSANGASIISGPAFRQKYQWVVSTVMPTSDAGNFDAMFRAWDQDRANGLPVACGITDTTFGGQVDADVVFVTPPSYTYFGPGFSLVSFGLMEA